MELDTPLRDPTSSPAVHIQWQNSQSACATMDELRVASSVPRRRKFEFEPFVELPDTLVLMCLFIQSTPAPRPLTFDFELPASAGPSSHASDPFFSSRTRLRSARSRNIDRVQSRSQNDVFATPTPAADASKFLDMLGRASARVDENSRKRMKALGERARGPKRPLIKGKERLCAKTRGTRSMDELGDHTNFIRDVPETSRVHYSSLPIMLESQSKDTAAEYNNDVHMHSGTSATAAAIAAAVPAPGNAGIKPPVSTRPQNGAQLFPPRATLSTRHSQKRIEPPSPTPVRSSTPIPFRPVPAPPAPTPVPTHRPKLDPSRTSDFAPPKSTPRQLPHPSDIHSQQPHPVPTPLPPAVNDVLNRAPAPAPAPASAVPMTDSLARHGRSTSTSSSTSASATAATSTSLISAHPPPSQTHGRGSKRALGMTRTVPRSFSSSSSSSNNNNNNTPHSAATKKPFRPPLARPSAAAAASQATTVSAAATKPQIPPTTSSHPHSHDSQRQRRQEDAGKKGSGADPDSSFDLSFDFDPEALEAAMKQYD
jgi:hypothetical protein